MSAEKVIVIYADFGGFFIWEKMASDMSMYCGGTRAGYLPSLSQEYGTSAELDAAFAEWIRRFDRTDYDTTLDWDQFHHDGIELAKRLKAEVGDRYEVEYQPPWEDPVRNGRPFVRIVTPEQFYVYNPILNEKNTPRDAAKPEVLSMKIGGCSAGWISMDLACGEQKVQISLTYVFDPVPDFIKWMEELITGQEFCAFRIEEEGPQKEFRGINRAGGNVELIITEPNHQPIEYLSKTVSRRQLVETIYHGLQSFGQSPEYLPKEWELETLGQWLERQTSRSQSEILNFLEILDHRAVTRFFHAVSPAMYHGWIPDEVRGMRSLEEMLSYALNPCNQVVQESLADCATAWTLDEECLDRRKVLEEFLNEQASPYAGTPLRTLRSERLDAYLASDRDRQTV